MEVKQSSIIFDVENSVVSLLCFEKQLIQQVSIQKIGYQIGVSMQLLFIVMLYLTPKIMEKIQIYYVHLI